jgi:hypothetical protein
MLPKDFDTVIDRLNGMITGELRERVDTMNAASAAGWGTLLNVVHLVRAIRTLHGARQCSAALPLFRSLLEYTVGTIWIADSGQDAVDVLNQGLLHSHEKFEEHLDAGTVDWRSVVPTGAVATFTQTRAIPREPHPEQRLLGFAHLLVEYGFEDFRPAYDALSSASHLSNVGAQRFVSMSGGTTFLSLTPLIDEPVDCLVFSMKMQFDAMLAYNELLTNTPWRGDLYRIAGEYGIEVKHRRRVSRSREDASGQT